MTTPESVTKLLDEFFSPASSEEPEIAVAVGGDTSPKRTKPPPPPSARGVGPAVPRVSAPPPRGAGNAPPPPSARRPNAPPPPPPSMRPKAPPPPPSPAQTLQGVAPEMQPNPLMQTLQGVAPVPGRSHAPTAKGIAPPPAPSPPKRESTPPPAPLAAAFAKTSAGIAPPPMDIPPPPPVDVESSPSAPERLAPLPQKVIGEASSPSSAPSAGIVAEDAEAKRKSVHDVPTDPGGPESAVLPPESAWGAPASLVPPALDAPEASLPESEPVPGSAAATERRPSSESIAVASAAETPATPEASSSVDPPAAIIAREARPLSSFDTATVAEDEEDSLPPPALAAKLDASDVEFTRPLPAELAVSQYSSGDDDLTRPFVSAADLPRAPSGVLPPPAAPPERPPVPVVVAFPPPRASAIDHGAPSVQIAADSSTEVTVPRSPLHAAGPTGLPRIPPPAPVPAEFNDRTSRRSRPFAESIAPATGSIFPGAGTKAFSTRTMLAAAAAVVGLGALVLILRPSSGSMVLTVGGPGGAAVKGISVKVDGKERCTATPCEIEDLKPGEHVITASAAGITGATDDTVRIARGEQTAHHVTLRGERLHAPEAPPEQPAAEAPKAEPKLAAVQPPKEEPRPSAAESPLDGEPEASKAEAAKPSTGFAPSKAEPASRSEPIARASRNTRPAAIAPKATPPKETSVSKPMAVAGSKATLDVSSTPRAAVVVNGRPVGMTPLKGLRVEPGKQTIVFVHPELGRKVASANVAPGARTTVGVKF